ncbi:MAG: CDP-alcohol phosphatidyltransferase family protein [Gammaproteobacteria bacterium]|jgi:phosphatidylglycerophosphate synthase|nr:CDP-alcohol phosphatidyltransferase family protein [Gammaproteobacteria bacterium]
MTHTYICILKDSEISLWGLSGKERLIRMIESHDNVELVDRTSQVPENAPVLLLRGDYLFESRVLKELIGRDEDVAVSASNSDQIVAARASSSNLEVLSQELLGESDKKIITTLEIKKAADLVNAYDPRLLKYDPPFILPVNQANKYHLENELFDGSYKGVTDFITKWFWPIPARWAVKLCVHYGWSPNQVTILSLVLAIFAGLAFWGGYLYTGLVMGWFMTFLDTVDGKLARVTITSSKMGDILDHGLDLIHPPLWYLAWGLGISEMWGSSLSVISMFWIILAAYIGGRFCEGGFELWIAPFRLFLWQPWDSYNRLITARRNPNLLILTLALICGRPDIGLWLVLIWHVASTLVLMARLLIAQKHKKKFGELKPWLNSIDPERDRKRLDVRLFTRLSKSAP